MKAVLSCWKEFSAEGIQARCLAPLLSSDVKVWVIVLNPQIKH